jgi:small-conductance mechanosensitive channel
MTQIDWPTLVRSLFSQETAFTLSIAILILGVVASYSVWRATHRVLDQAGINDVVEGTPFERTARSFNTSTVGIIATLGAIFAYVAAIILALSIARMGNPDLFWSQLTAYFPRLFVAALAVVTGLVVGDKAKLLVSERLRSIKLPEVDIIPELVKYSVFYIAALIALGQIGVATSALLILLAVYAFAIVFLGGLAFKDLLASGAAGIYLLLSEPYSIGDQVRIDEHTGVVQEVDMFKTRIENEGREYIVPNRLVLRSSIVRIRS